MLLRGLFFALLLYLLYRFVSRKLSAGGSHKEPRQKNLDHIEEAEYEDITEKEKKY